MNLRNFVLSYGFAIVMVGAFVGLSLGTPNFLKVSNLMNMMHAAVSLSIIALGLALVIMTRHLDISVGSVAFISTTIGSVLMVHHGVPPLLAIPIILLSGVVFGALNGFIVVVLKVNSFIATLGTMIALRGIGLQILKGRVLSMPPTLRGTGNVSIGPVFVDVLIALAIVLIVHFIQSRTRFGRYILAIGSEPEVAERMGVRVRRIAFASFVLSGFFASAGGIASVLQLGVVTLRMGLGLEFTAIAAVVIGGISLFGGKGSIVPGILLGVYTLALIENGLNHLGASPYLYPFVRGGLIFIAMYADSLRSKVKPTAVASAEETEEHDLSYGRA
jgi:ribose/xylose/arabinose/galactoside ABC-type transport system permease subunit